MFRIESVLAVAGAVCASDLAQALRVPVPPQRASRPR